MSLMALELGLIYFLLETVEYALDYCTFSAYYMKPVDN